MSQSASMDPRIRIWNVLHDGQITVLEGEGTETVTMFVSIPYLRRRMQPLGDSFVLTLSGVTRLEFRNFDGTSSSLGKELELGALEILSTKSKSMPIRLETTVGKVELDYQSISVAAETGASIPFEVIDRACQQYWAELHAKAAAVRHDSADARAAGEKLRALQEAALKKSPPVADLAPGWFFSVVVTSDLAWQAEGKDRRGRVVSHRGVDGNEVLAKCAELARALDAGSAGP